MANGGPHHSSAARFEVERTPKAGYRFSFFDAGDALVFRSGSFKSLADAFAAITALKRHVKSRRFQRLSKAEFLCFTVSGPNHTLLATSAPYPDAATLEAAITAVVRDVPTAPVFNGTADAGL